MKEIKSANSFKKDLKLFANNTKIPEVYELIDKYLLGGISKPGSHGTISSQD